MGDPTNATANALSLKREVLEIFLLLEFLHSLLATCGLLLGCQTPPSPTYSFGRSLINGCGSFCLLLRITAAAYHLHFMGYHRCRDAFRDISRLQSAVRKLSVNKYRDVLYI